MKLKYLALEAKTKCPAPTQDITLNLKNRQTAIDEYGYGPADASQENKKFWQKKMDMWNTDSADELKNMICGTCAAFDITKKTLDCIDKGIGGEETTDSYDVIDAGQLGYCRFLKFKCAAKRTCDAWVTGGPLKKEKNESVNESKPQIKKGLIVKIKSSYDIDKYNFTDDYKKYLKQIAGKTVKIKRAFRSTINRGYGPIEKFEVDGYKLYKGISGFDKLIIDKIITHPQNESTNESKIKMNALDWGKSTAERNANLDKYDSLKTDKEREAFLRKLKGESVVTEAKLSFSDLKKGQVLLNKFRRGRKYTILDVNPKFVEVKNLETGNVIQIYSLNNYELKESVNEATPEEEDEFHRNLDKLVHKTFGHSSDEKKMNEANEPDIISQLRDVVKNGYQTLKDPKSGKKMKVDSYSASAVTQVYDALKQQSNKDKFVSMGLVGMVNMAFKLLNKQEIVEYDVETLEELNDFHQFMKEYKVDINEAEYQGRKVKLGKPMQGDVKKFKVYVKNDKGNVVKVNFGQKGMNIKKDNPDARKSFRARHNCDNPGPRWKARYWSCRKW
jgi:hypothetical protein